MTLERREATSAMAENALPMTPRPASRRLRRPRPPSSCRAGRRRSPALGLLRVFAPASALFFSTAAVLAPAATQAFSVPGTSNTENGYDNEDAYQPMCWMGLGYDASADAGGATSDGDGIDIISNVMTTNASRGGTPWDNKLVKDFYLTEDVRLFRNCPAGVDVRGDAPIELTRDGEKLRTGQWYNYTVHGSFDLSSLEGGSGNGAAPVVVSSDHGAVLGVQVILCELGRVGLCTPFVHEHANARLKAEGRTVPVEKGDRHGGTHVHSPTNFIPVERSSGGGVQEFSVDVEVLMNRPGNFFAIAAFQMFTADAAVDGEQGGASPLVVERKYDVSNALETRLISYYDPPEIMRVTNEVTIASGVLIAVGVGILFFLLQQAVANIRGQVMTLSQGPFLVVFLLSAALGTVSSFLFNPQSDLYCTLDGPMVLIPITLMYSVVIGRLWRINAVISPLLSITLRTDQKRVFSSRVFALLDRVAKMRLIEFCRRRRQERRDDQQGKTPGSPRRRSKQIRVKVTWQQLARVIFLFTLPQIVLQVLSLTHQPDALVVHFNEDESIGRAECRNNDDPTSIEKWSMYYLIILFVAMLGLAHESRNLPSLFNETRSIYDSVLVSILIVVICQVVIYLSDTPTTSPDVEYILKVIMILSMSLNTTLRIMCPKLKLIWSGQQILVSKLVSDQHGRHSSCSHYNGSSGRRSAPFHSTIKFLGDSHMRQSGGASSPVNGYVNGGSPQTGGVQKQVSKWGLMGGNLNHQRANIEQAGRATDDAKTDPTAVPSGTAVSGTSSVELRIVSGGQQSSTNQDSAVEFPFSNDGAAEEHTACEMEEGSMKRAVSFKDEDGGGEETRTDGEGSQARLPMVLEKEESSRARRHTAPDISASDDDDDDGSIGVEVIAADDNDDDDELLGRLPSSTHSAPALTGPGVEGKRVAPAHNRKSISERRFGHKVSSVVEESDFQDSVDFAAEASANRARHLRWRLRSRNDLGNGGGGSGHHGRDRRRRGGAPVLTAASAEIRITDYEAPARRLMLRMIDMHELLERVNRQVMTGLAVSHEDWDTMREACTELGDVFRNDVTFDWEEEEGGGIEVSNDVLARSL